MTARQWLPVASDRSLTFCPMYTVNGFNGVVAIVKQIAVEKTREYRLNAFVVKVVPAVERERDGKEQTEF